MGKKKIKSERPKSTEQFEPKAQKSYSFAAEAKTKQDDTDKLLKVQIPTKLEAAILDVILFRKQLQHRSGSASFRITNKKLMDIYMSLSQTGFKHGQIEMAMSNTVTYGGDLMDALDWLCLNTHNDQLPDGFSQRLAEEDQKRRPKFKGEDQTICPSLSANPLGGATANPSKLLVPEALADKTRSHKGFKVKSWILQYAEQSSDSDELDEDGKVKVDPNSRYLELTAMLLDTRESALQAKTKGDKAQAKAMGRQIQKYLQEMGNLEQDHAFNPAIKVKDVDLEKKSEIQEMTSSVTKATDKEPLGEENGDESNFGFTMFEEVAAVEKPKASPAKKKPVNYTKVSFTYTRQQWTGKSPKQFLIDWIRKNLPKSPPPAYKHVQVGSNLWKSRAIIVRKEGDLDVCPSDIVCENVKEAEHLASTLALYNLCKGQRIYQLLPPPYRDVWLDWQEAEDKLKNEAKIQENKPRDQFISHLLKKLKVEGPAVTPGGVPDEELEETWEDLDTAEDKPLPNASSKTCFGASNDKLKSIMTRNQTSKKYRDLLMTRKQLPVYSYRDEILHVIRKQRVVIIAGETGSGKSTQIPHFILEDLIHSGQAGSGGIVCTQPRRISAVSLSARVCDELGESKPGRSDGLCGYQIRFESKKSESTRLTYCTTGVLLRQLQQDPELKHISHFIVDEVHERSVQSDFLIILLRRLLEKRHDMKIILMSATLEADKFSSYFQHCPIIEIPGRTFPVQSHHLEDVLEMTGYTLESGSIYSLRIDQIIEEHKSKLQVTGKGGSVTTRSCDWAKQDLSKIDLTDLDASQYCLKTRNIVTRINPNRVNLELIVDLISYLDEDPEYSSIDGAILVFLPGMVHIQDLYDSLKADRRFADEKKYKILALHSVLSSDDQSAAFAKPPPGVRKIIIATNIAETGITIPDVVFVIDSGKVKENRYVESSQLSSLEEVFVSQASAKQRQGRAGRVRDGICFRMYTHDHYERLKKYSVPEILRVPLEELCLHIMKCELGNPSEFLAQALSPPLPQGIARAMSILREVEACHPVNTTLTPLGHHLAKLPVNVRIGKMLVYSAIFGCLEPVAVIAAALTEKSPFVSPIGKRDQADVAKQSLAVENSDHLTLLKAYLMWQTTQLKGYHAEQEFCNRFFLKRNNLKEINNIALDLMKLVRSSGFGDMSTKGQSSMTSITFTADQLSAKMVSTIKAVLTAGLYPNIAHVSFTPKVDSAANPEHRVCMAVTQQGALQVHPSSINRFLAANGWLVYHEKIKLGRPYIRDSSLISCYPLLLYGGDIEVQHKDQLITIDNWIKLKAYAKTAVIFKELRKLISYLLADKLDNPKLPIQDDPVVQIIHQLINSEKTR